MSLLPFAVLAAIALVCADGRRPRVFAAVKPTATLCLLLVAWSWSSFGLAIQVGLTLSAVGDAALNRKGEKAYLLVGIGLFMLAHGAYVTAFLSGAGSRLTPGAIAITAAAAAGAGVLLRALWSAIPPALRPPCVVYGLLIAATVGAAGTVPAATGNVLLAGAVLFYFGDVALALSLFGRPFPYSQTTSMFLYWSGQLGFALATRWQGD